MAHPAEKRLNFLDGIRGWGAAIVLLHHLSFSGMSVFGQSVYTRFITDGHFAVYVFYVLSGFVLTIKFIEKPAVYSIAEAVAARYFRLMIPIIATSFIAYLLFVCGLLFNHEAAKQSHSNWLDGFFSFAPSFGGFLKFSLYDVFFKYDPNKTYNSSLGTITYEFWGSMLAFFIVAVFVQTEKPRRFYLIPVAALAVFFTVYSSPIACFVYGYMLAELYHARPKNLKYIATALFPLVVFGVTFIHWHDNSFHLIVLATAMVFAGCFSPWLQAFFSNRFSHFLGAISFPLYLIHISIICSASSRLYLYLSSTGYSVAATELIVTIITIALAVGIAWLLVPLDKFSTRFSRKIGEKALSYLAPAIK